MTGVRGGGCVLGLGGASGGWGVRLGVGGRCNWVLGGGVMRLGVRGMRLFLLVFVLFLFLFFCWGGGVRLGVRGRGGMRLGVRGGGGESGCTGGGGVWVFGGKEYVRLEGSGGASGCSGGRHLVFKGGGGASRFRSGRWVWVLEWEVRLGVGGASGCC